MIGMKLRFEISQVELRISNVSPRDADSYVLMTVTDDQNNEIAFALSHEQAEHLQIELYEANRRWKTSASANEPAVNDDQYAH